MVHKVYFYLVLYFFSIKISLGQPGILTIRDLKPVSIQPMNCLNSPYRETNPCLTPDGRYLFFMSGRGGESWSNPTYTKYNDQEEADGDIYFSQWNDSSWSEPVNLGSAINTSMGEDEPNVSPDGQFVFFQSWKEGWDTTGGPYYRAELFGNVWGKPEGLGGNIHRFFLEQIKKNGWYYATDGSSLSPDGKFFIFAAGKWYDEPMDLYISIHEAGEWTYPRKMSLSTRGDDRSVFIAADSRTLFFSSSGYGGNGGLDIFKTVIDPEGNHGQIINLGTVFNTEKDDFGFTMNVEGTDIFYTQDADIIRVILKNPDRLLKPLPTLVINGVIMDYEGHPVEAVVRISRKEDMQTVAKAKSNALTGEYSVAIQKADERYIKEITAANFREHREEIEILDPDNSSRMENRDLLIRANSELIFFDLDDSRIRDSEIDKMDSIITYLYNHKRSKVLLTGHADQLGTDRYNLELSSKRVEEVKTYFEKKGIPSRIMKTRFVGESQPLESHPRGEKSPINRRVEVLIVPAE
jgi:outer membrane protein OmpA-like peptidoglycan-associated protein